MESYYFENQGDGTFKEKGLPMGLAFGQRGQGVSHMGPVAGDVDGDGRLDLLIPDLDYGSLLMNKGAYFVDAIDQSGLALMTGQYTGWGGVPFDYDNDGWLDVFVATGNAHHEYPEDPVLARNVGARHLQGRCEGVRRLLPGRSTSARRHLGRLRQRREPRSPGGGPERASPPPSQHGRNGQSLAQAVDARIGGRQAHGHRRRVTVTTGERRQVQDVIGVNGYLSQGDVRRPLRSRRRGEGRPGRDPLARWSRPGPDRRAGRSGPSSRGGQA